MTSSTADNLSTVTVKVGGEYPPRRITKHIICWCKKNSKNKGNSSFRRAQFNIRYYFQFSCHKSFSTSHANCVEPSQFYSWSFLTPVCKAWEIWRGSEYWSCRVTMAASHSPTLPVQINKMLPHWKSSGMQVQNWCLGKETKDKKEKEVGEGFIIIYHWPSRNIPSWLSFSIHSQAKLLVSSFHVQNINAYFTTASPPVCSTN